VNDCDHDVCLATWILMNPDRAPEPLVRILSQVEDLLDSSAGTFPMPHDRDLLGEIRWVFEPYARARPHLTGMGSDPMRQVILDVHLRIDQFLIGRAGHLPLRGAHTAVGGGDGWVFVEVSGPNARERLVAAGVRAAVELTARVGDRFAYSVWRRSEYVAWFSVPDILAALNLAEGFEPVDVNGWGGADNVGGSPRGRGSVLAPAEVQSIAAGVVEARRPRRPR
jgi:hypothetical protein